MTNEQKYKTTLERVNAYCASKGLSPCTVGYALAVDYFGWLAIEAEDEKPAPCPFCGGETRPVHFAGVSFVKCDCGYTSPVAETEDAAIAAHNRVAKAVRQAEKGTTDE